VEEVEEKRPDLITIMRLAPGMSSWKCRSMLPVGEAEEHGEIC
jgi:hypothetical protein